MPDYSELLVFYGDKTNVLTRDNVVASASQTPDSIFPLSRTIDGRPSQRFIFPALQEDDFVLYDINGIAGGDFNVWLSGEPVSWDVTLSGTGAIVEEVSSPVVDGSSLEMSNGANGNVEVENTIEVLSGETVGLFLYTQTSNADSPNEVEIYNKSTGKYLTINGWSRRQQNFKTYSDTSLASQEETFEVEEYVSRHSVTLRVRLHMDNASASRLHHFDNVFMIPASSVASVHSHNMDPAIIPRLSSSMESLTSVPVESATGFDGSSDMQKTTNFSGLIESNKVTGSIWFKMMGGDASAQFFFAIGSDRFQVLRTSSNTLQIVGRNNVGTVILNIATTGTVTADGTWHHLLFSVDLGTTSSSIYLDGVLDQAVTTRTAGNIDFDIGTSAFGATTASANRLNAQVGDAWFYFGQYFDLSVTANLRKWRTAGGRSAYLGASGELPVGSNPHVFLSNNAGTFNINAANSGNFETVNGTLTDEVSLEAEFTIADPAFYAQLSGQRFRRFWRYLFKGANPNESIEVGQLALGDPIALLRNPIEREVEEVEILPLEKLKTRVSGETWTNVHSKQKQRGIRLRFSHRNAHQKRLADLIWNRTRFGADPAIVIPDTRKDLVIHGEAERNQISSRRKSVDIVETELIFAEDPHGITLS